jgi:ABC-type oligopeptide transport system substrate-binding subunit
VNGPVIRCDEASVEKNRTAARELMTSFYRGGAVAAEHLGVVSLIYEADTVNARIIQQVKQQWQEVLGITVEAVSVESEAMQKALESGAFSIALLSASDVTNTASGYLEDYVSDSFDNYGQHYSNAYDILLRAADNSDSVEARDAYLADAERLLLESGYVIPLCNSTYRYLFRPTLTGLLQQDMGVYNFSAVTEIPVA